MFPSVSPPKEPQPAGDLQTEQVSCFGLETDDGDVAVLL